MQAIETRYKGYRFRSRLEARWAVYLDAIGLKWEYEKEGFDFGGGVQYLPDFWLPELDMWAEVKAGDFTDEELKKAWKLAQETEKRVFLLRGVPSEEHAYDYLDPHVIETEEELHMIIDDPENRQDYVQNARGHFVFLYAGDADVALAGKSNDQIILQQHYEGLQTPSVISAVNAARSARFEFGQSGAVT